MARLDARKSGSSAAISRSTTSASERWALPAPQGPPLDRAEAIRGVRWAGSRRTEAILRTAMVICRPNGGPLSSSVMCQQATIRRGRSIAPIQFVMGLGEA